MQHQGLVVVGLLAIGVAAACDGGLPGKGGIIDGDDDAADGEGADGGTGDAGDDEGSGSELDPDDDPLPAITVCPQGGEYQTIQSAIDAADDGRTVEVCAGTYDERLVIERPVALVGVGGAEAVIVDANGAGSGVVVREVATPGVLLRGFTIRNGNSSEGGGVRCTSSALSLEDVTVTASAALSGGALSGEECDLAITASQFTGNSAQGGGGALHLVRSSGEVSDGVIAGNTANLGAGVFQEEGSVAITGNDIHDNAAADGAGAIWLDSDGAVTGNRIADNSAVERGGGLSVIRHAPKVSDNLVTGNRSGDDGAGIYVFLSKATLTDNEIVGNDSAGDAGGLRVLGSQATIVGNQVRDNTAVGDGGGMKISHNQSVVHDNVFDGNSAGGYGGGVELDDDWSTLSRLTITNNSAHRGGGLDCHEAASSFRVEHTLIAGNSADASGGGVRLIEVTATATFAFVTIADNSAPEVGGADFASAEEEIPPEANVRRIVVENSIIAGNEGVQVRFERGEIRRWQYTNVSPAIFAGMSNPAGSSGNVSASPQFVNPGSGNYRLQAGSPSRDAGDPALDDRDGSRADMGAYGGPDGL